jgi:hypothetical protein
MFHSEILFTEVPRRTILGRCLSALGDSSLIHRHLLWCWQGGKRRKRRTHKGISEHRVTVVGSKQLVLPRGLISLALSA